MALQSGAMCFDVIQEKHILQVLGSSTECYEAVECMTTLKVSRSGDYYEIASRHWHMIARQPVSDVTLAASIKCSSAAILLPSSSILQY